MDWSRIKTIFILTFLVLDIYLVYEFFKLKADEIEFVDLPKNHQKDLYLSAKPKIFLDEELKELSETKLKGQKLSVSEGTRLDAILDKPYQLSENIDQNELNAFVKTNILHGEQYRFWKKEDNIITYYQQYDDKMFYKNFSGELTLYLSVDHNIVSYGQTFLEDVEKLSEEDKIIQPLKAVEMLYEKGSLRPKSKITKVELGYFTFVNTSTAQVLTPAWRFVINDDENIFVHAFEGQIIQLTEEKKIVE